MTASSINYEVVTHVNHAFAWPDESGNILSYNNMLSLDFCQTIQSNGAKVLLSLGGWGNDVGLICSFYSCLHMFYFDIL